jgi:glycosyltransferase involved in cell wall biosynthesis
MEIINILKSHRFKKMKNPAMLKHYVLIAINRLTYLIFDSFFYIIENTLGLLIALIDIRRRKKIGNKILVCRNKNYNLHSGFESMEKVHIDAVLIDNGYEVDLFYWDEDNSLFINQVKLWLKIRKLNPWIIFFSSYSPTRMRPSTQPSVKYLGILRKKMSSNIIFFWWDTCSDSFYDNHIKKLEKLKSIHLIIDNPLLDFGDKHRNLSDNSLIPLWTNYDENSFAKPLKKDIDVAFLGQISEYRDDRRNYIEYLMEQNISGYIASLNRDQQVEHSKYFEILGRAKIGINFSYSVDKHQLKGRVLEIMHSGAMLLETKNPQIEILFNDGIDYVSFSNKEDLVKKIKYYLIHEQERESIALSGRQKVLKLYNSKLFIKKIFEHKDFVSEKSSNFDTD